jgi:hypothetical protein
MDVYAAIEAKHGFAIPAEYRRIVAAGYFDLRHPGKYYDPANEPTYLWVPEAEWLLPQKILAHKPESFEKPGFVPFAFTGAGDHWCWWPSQDTGAVVLCPHDEATGVFDAPSFLASIYRRFLDYALADIGEDEEAEARRHFAHWASQLEGHFPQQWITTLTSLVTAPANRWQQGRRAGRGFLTPQTYDELIARDIAFPRLGEEFEWMD